MNNPEISNIMASLKGLNLWTLRQKIKDNTVQRTPTMQLFQCIDIFKFNPKTAALDAKMLMLLDNFKPLDNPNLKFKSNSRKNAQRFLERYGEKRTTGFMKSHSFVLQFLQWLEHQIAAPFRQYADDIVMRDTSNTLRTIGTTDWYNYSTSHCAPGGLEAASGDDSCGIVVGTGVTAPANSDYKMETKIAQGNASGQLQHAATSVGGAGINGANVDMIISRILINGSGGTITLKEIGIYMKNALQTTWAFLLIHDAVNQTINNGEVALVSYDMRTTV
jgi:hypothetical protein